MKIESAPQYVECAHVKCKYSAFARVKIGGNFAALCKPHYDLHGLDEAKKFTTKLGLQTVEQMRAWIKANPPMRPPSKAWAYKLQERHINEDLNPTQVQLYQAVVGMKHDEADA